MKRGLYIAALVLTGVLIWGGVEAALLIRDARVVVNETRQHVFEASDILNQNLLYLRGTLTSLSEASLEWHETQVAQRKYWAETGERVNRILDEAYATIADARGLIQRLDANVNESVLPEAAADLRELRVLLTSLDGSANALHALLTDSENAAVREQALKVLEQAQLTVAQGERTLAAFEHVGAEIEKVPPMARKALWVQILVAIASAVRP